MTSGAPGLGRCPECDAHVPEAWLFIEYEKANGETGLWAECPACNDVVSPD